MPKNIDILRQMNSAELADFLAIERERMAESILAMFGVKLPENIRVAIRAVLKDFLESEVEA